MGKNVGATKQEISLLLLAYRDLENQKQRLSPEIVNQVDDLPERTLRELRKAPETAKPAIYENVVKHDLNSPQAKELVQTAKNNPEITNADIAMKAQEISEYPKEPTVSVEERAQQYRDRADKLLNKTEKALTKVVDAVPQYPEVLMTAVYGHLSLNSKGNKVSVEKAHSFANIVVGILFQRLSSVEVDALFAEAEAWRQ